MARDTDRHRGNRIRSRSRNRSRSSRSRARLTETHDAEPGEILLTQQQIDSVLVNSHFQSQVKVWIGMLYI